LLHFLFLILTAFATTGQLPKTFYLLRIKPISNPRLFR